MTSKKPLNFAQALRVKPGEAREPPELPKEEPKPIEAVPASEPVVEQSVASHPTTQLFNQKEEAEWQATKPPTEIQYDSWQATQPPILYEQMPPQPSEKPKKDYSKMPSRWGKKDQNYRINAQIAERFKLTCQLNKWSMSEIVQDLLDAFMTGKPPSHQATYAWWQATKPPSHQATKPPSHQATKPHDDLMIDDDDSESHDPPSSINHQLHVAESGKPPSHQPEDELLDFYARWTHNTIKDADRAARESVSHIPVDICKAAILTVFARAKRKINSFQYFVEEIRFTYETTPSIGRDFIQHMMYAIGRDRGLEFVPEGERGWVTDMLKARGKL
ncbi:MAG: hypothetical protein MN733_37160 [Nitrososphaera sp.]|nr:hypothetical protein [Nitrososphaera sp.]